MKQSRVYGSAPLLLFLIVRTARFSHGFSVPAAHSRLSLSTASSPKIMGAGGRQDVSRLFQSPEHHVDAEVVGRSKHQSNTKIVDATVLRNNNKSSTDPTPAIVSLLKNVAPSTKIMTAVLTMMLLLLPLPSWAVGSGGRMGGSFSAPSTSRSYSAPRTYSRSTYSYSRPPSVIVTPSYSPFFSPFGYYGSPGIITYSRGPSLFSLLVFGGIALTIANAFRNTVASSTTTTSVWDEGRLSSALGSGTSVVRLSVALDISNRDDPNSMLSVLRRLSYTANTDSRMGVQNLTSQVALELLRRKSSIVSASSSYNHFQDRTKAQREFNAISIQERSKFEQETISKFGGVDYSSSQQPKIGGDSSSSKATMAVVTLVLAIDGDATKVRKIRSLRDVEDALEKIASGSIVDDCLQGAEILWAPEDRFETLSRRDVIADYPDLVSI